MASKVVCAFVAIVAAISYTQAQTVNVTCEFRVVPIVARYSCVINSVTIPDDEYLEISFVGQHLEGRSNADVELVQITSSNIPFVMSQLFTTFPNLQIFEQTTNLTRIQPNAFANASSLIHYRTFGNLHLRTIQANAFAGASRLQVLFIMGGGVQIIDENAFNGLSQVEDISLVDNEIKELPINVFRPLKSVTFIRLGINQLESIPGRLFEANSRLYWVGLNFNRINAIERNLIDNIPALERLELIENVCADSMWDTDWPDVTLDTMREGLKTCFDNFDSRDVKTFTVELRGHLTIRDENGAEIITL